MPATRRVSRSAGEEKRLCVLPNVSLRSFLNLRKKSLQRLKKLRWRPLLNPAWIESATDGATADAEEAMKSAAKGNSTSRKSIASATLKLGNLWRKREKAPRSSPL